MKILFCIPHYYGESRYARGRFQGSSGATRRQERSERITQTLLTLKATFGGSQAALSHRKREAHAASHHQAAEKVDVLVATVGDNHLLADVPSSLFEHEPCECAPMMLGFECQRLMRDRIGLYDYYCFLEDDLLITDGYFFHKLAWFNQLAGTDAILFPNRFETGFCGPILKCYIDWDLRPELTAHLQDLETQRTIAGDFLGSDILFRKPNNPHAAAYFLNLQQMKTWMQSPWCYDRDCSLVGPGESAACLGLLRLFRVYKPAIENAGFLEVHHQGDSFLRLIGKEVKLGRDRAVVLE